MLARLPQSDYSPSPSAGIALAGAALLLIPVDIALANYGLLHPDRIIVGAKVETHVVDGVESETITEDVLFLQSLWVDPARIAVPLLVVSTLIALGRINRQDVGLTVGRPHRTLFWMIAPLVAGSVVCVVAIAVAALIIRGTGLPTPVGLGETLTPAAFWDHGYVWRSFWHVCVLTPLFEDLLYRGVLAPALERIGGAWFAMLGSGLAWASLHVVYDRPIAWFPLYFVSGMLGCWIVLKSRSLVPVVTLHALWNAAVPFGYDLLVLRFPELVPGIFGSRQALT